MQATDSGFEIVAKIRLASTSCETKFLRIGRTLEESVSVISAMVLGFDPILEQLKGEELSTAVKALGEISSRIAGLERSRGEANAQLQDVSQGTNGISARLLKMSQAVQAIFPLVTNSKIAIAAIRTLSVDFSTFADDIKKTADKAAGTLDDFRTKLQRLRGCFQEACKIRRAFEERQKEAARVIPGRLQATVESLPPQHRRIAEAVSTIKQRSERVRTQICTAILALQAGDTARQRLEHIEYGFDLLAKDAATCRGAHMASDTEIARSAAVMRRLLAAQLTATTERFQQDIHQITAALKGLSDEARNLRSLAHHAYGASDQDRSSFMTQLQSQVGEALGLFTDFEKTQSAAAAAMTSVSDTAGHLCRDLKIVQSLEADIRIMGLNASLRCARVGPDGRALDLIAQELRTYGGLFAKEAGTLMGEVESLAGTTGAIEAGSIEAAELIAASRQSMEQALGTLQRIGNMLGETLATLDHASGRIVQLLDETASSLDAQDEISGAMQDALALLQQGMNDAGCSIGEAPSGVMPLLEQLERVYTMAEERTVHNRLLGRPDVPAPASAAASTELEDMLF